MPRHKNVNWNLPEGRVNDRGTTSHSEEVVANALLMDIRDELQALNSTLSCYRVREMADACVQINRRLRNAGVLLTPKRKRKA